MNIQVFYFFETLFKETTCVNGQYKKSSSCFECNTTKECLTCDSPNACTSCLMGNVLSDGTCICGINEYKTYYGNCEPKYIGAENFNYIKDTVPTLSSYDLAINMAIAAFS